MFAWVEVFHDRKGCSMLHYSLGFDTSCDGRIRYDEAHRVYSVVRLSKSANESQTEDLLRSLRERKVWEWRQKVCIPYESLASSGMIIWSSGDAWPEPADIADNAGA